MEGKVKTGLSEAAKAVEKYREESDRYRQSSGYVSAWEHMDAAADAMAKLLPIYDRLTADRYRWIVYFGHRAYPGGADDPVRAESLDDVRRKFQTYADSAWGAEVYGVIYGYDADAWESACEFRGVGCPFDYPNKLIEHGPRKGIRITNA